MALQRAFHIFVVSLFSLSGGLFVLSAFGFVRKIGTVVGPYFEAELDPLLAVAFFLAAVGLYRFDRRVRGFAILLSALMLLPIVVAVALSPGTIAVRWLLVWVFALYWLLSSPVRARFVAASAGSKAA